MKPNAFRVINKNLVEKYKLGDLSNLPNLEGYNFNNEKTVNTFKYDPNKKYLHFFPSFAVANEYLSDLPHKEDEEFCICEFHFDEEFLRKNKFKGRYYSKIDMKEIFRDEYIFSSKHYSKENFLKISDPEEHSKHVGYDPDAYMGGWY